MKTATYLIDAFKIKNKLEAAFITLFKKCVTDKNKLKENIL